MIPLGVLASRRAAAGGGPVVLTHTDSAEDSGNRTNYAFADLDIGSPGAGRTVVVVVHARNVGSVEPVVTIGGASATVDAAQGNSNWVVIARAAVTSGATATVEATFGDSSTNTRAAVGVWVSPVPLAVVATDATQSSSVTLAGAADRAFVAGTMQTTTGQTLSWTGSTSRYLISISSAGGSDGVAAGASHVVTAAFASTNAQRTAAAAYRAA